MFGLRRQRQCPRPQLHRRRSQRVRGLLLVSPLHPPPALKTVPDVYVKLSHHRLHRRNVHLILGFYPVLHHHPATAGTLLGQGSLLHPVDPWRLGPVGRHVTRLAPRRLRVPLGLPFGERGRLPLGRPLGLRQPRFQLGDHRFQLGHAPLQGGILRPQAFVLGSQFFKCHTQSLEEIASSFNTPLTFFNQYGKQLQDIDFSGRQRWEGSSHDAAPVVQEAAPNGINLRCARRVVRSARRKNMLASSSAPGGHTAPRGIRLRDSWGSWRPPKRSSCGRGNHLWSE